MITLEQAIEKIIEMEPSSKEFFKCEDGLLDYFNKKNIDKHKFDPVHLERQKEYSRVISGKIKKLFLDEHIKIDFDKGIIVDTTDHHGLLNFPLTLGAHVFSNFKTILNRKEYGDYYTLGSGNITLNNVAFRRGINLGGKHINLYPKKDKNKLVSRYPSFNFDVVSYAKNNKQKFNNKEITFLERLQGIIDRIDFSSCERFSDQVVKINYYIWQEFFSKEIRGNIRRCITLEHDEILITFLISFLKENKDNIIWKSLFDEKFRNIVIKKFNGIYGAWNYNGGKSGTYFFWGFCKEDGKEYKMKLDGDTLVCQEGKIRSIKLEPDDIIAALKEGILIPAIFLKFSTVAFYMGAKVLGGPAQVDYVSNMKKVWLSILENCDTREAELMKDVDVGCLVTLSLAFSRNNLGELTEEWGPDIAMNSRFSKNYLQNLKKVKLKDAFRPMIPVYYYKVTTPDNREKLNYSNNDIYKGFNWVK